MPRKLIRTTALLALLASSAQAQTITGYNLTNARPSGFGGFTHTYTGTITPIGGGLANYTGGGSGSLNDNLVAAQNGNMAFQVSDNTTLTLLMSGTFQWSSLTLFGGTPNPPNFLQGALTGATISFGGSSASLTSIATGVDCTTTGQLCDDRFDFAGTALAGLSGNSITISNFQGGFLSGGQRFFTITEVGVTAATSVVPEPATVALTGFGVALLGVAARRRRTV